MKVLLIALLLISNVALATEGTHEFRRAVWVVHPNGDEMVCFAAGRDRLLACAFQPHLEDAHWIKCVSGVEARTEYIICEPGV